MANGGNGSNGGAAIKPKPLPRDWNQELVDTILQRMSNGETLKAVCRDLNNFSASTFRGWVLENVSGLADRYARARILMLAAWAEDILEIAQDGTNDWLRIETKAGRVTTKVNRECIERSRLRIDTMKWLMSKLHPAQYGEHVQVDSNETGQHTIRVEIVHAKPEDIRKRFDFQPTEAPGGNGNGT